MTVHGQIASKFLIYATIFNLRDFSKPFAGLRRGRFVSILWALMTQQWPSMQGQGGEGRLWLRAFGWSLLVNFGLLLVLGLGLLESHLARKHREVRTLAPAAKQA